MASYTIIPAGIASFFLMFFALIFKLIRLEKVEAIAQFFLGVSGFILIPFFVNGLSYKELIIPIFWQWLLIITISTLITLVGTALTIQVFQRVRLFKRKGS